MSADWNRLFKRQRRNAAALAVLAVWLMVAAAYALFCREPVQLIFTAVYAACLVWAWKKRPELPRNFDRDDHQQLIQEMYDRSHKGALNWLFGFFLLMALLVFSALSASVVLTKPLETLTMLQTNLLLLEFVLILLGKNLILARRTDELAPGQNQRLYWKTFGLCALGSLLFWAVALIPYFVFNTGSFYAFFAAAGVYGLIVLLFTICIRKQLLFRNFSFSKVRVGLSAGLLAALAFYVLIQKDVWLTQPYINRVPNVNESSAKISYHEESGVYSIAMQDEDFRILQLTDIHLGGSYSTYTNDMKALKACFALIDHTRPDLVIVTGDLCYPMGIGSYSINNTAPVMQFAAFMRNTGIPWAFTYGNHDTESIAATDSRGLDELYRSLSYRTSKNLLYPYVQPAVTGRNNQLIEVRNADGTLHTALFLIDSNAYTGKGLNDYDYIHDDQVDWYAQQVERLCRQEGKTIPSMAFFHIPLQQYQTAYELYQTGSDQVQYHFGQNNEKSICCSRHPSSFFDRMKELGSTTAVFCGHDHYNNMSLEYQGIRLTYGMSIDYLAMPGIARESAQRGGTLITLRPDGGYDIRQVPLSSVPIEEE